MDGEVVYKAEKDSRRRFPDSSGTWKRGLAPLAGTAHRVLGANDACPLLPRRCSPTWAMLIKRVYEVDPLQCPQCAGEMKVIAFIEPRAPSRSDGRGAVIEKILRH